jgi:threonine synthase
MKYRSTRNGTPAVALSEAIRVGQAADGGLFLPERWPDRRAQGGNPGPDLARFATDFLTPFFADDFLARDLPQICAEAFDFPLPEIPLAENLSTLELFHGPTGAFKDFGARFLMACLDRLGRDDAPFTVLAATSGDTGGAVGCAAEGRSAVRAIILYPDGRVSPFQAHQLSCWRAPVTTLKIAGDFDACQRLVKTAFSDPELAGRYRLTSANSINIARLLPQAAYLAFAAHRHAAQNGPEPGFVIPTGNLGHGVAALIARACGAPIGPVRLATNANAALSEWAQSGRFRPRPSVSTLANAMDVGAPSNFERLDDRQLDLTGLTVERVSDDAIRHRIRLDHDRFGHVWCPHSACAAEAYTRLPSAARKARGWIIAATAHPFKFAESVEPVIDREVTPPPALSAVLDRSAQARACAPQMGALREELERLEQSGS